MVKKTSAIGRGALGSFLLGPVGLLAATSAKKKGVYLIAINFKDGSNSLLEVDEKIYKTLIQKLAFISRKEENIPASNDLENIPNQIKQLAELKKQKILTEEEFAKKKEELLAKL